MQRVMVMDLNFKITDVQHKLSSYLCPAALMPSTESMFSGPQNPHNIFHVLPSLGHLVMSKILLNAQTPQYKPTYGLVSCESDGRQRWRSWYATKTRSLESEYHFSGEKDA